MSAPTPPPIKAETLPGHPHPHRRFNLLSATALNMTNMMGAGPFITIPLLMSALGGPQAMLGWVVALVIVICDGMVWSELGAAMPGSGGSNMRDRKSTRLNSSHGYISYAVFCLKKKKDYSKPPIINI